MRAEAQPHEVRRLVVNGFRRFGAPPPSLFELQEQILIDRGRYVARTYRVEGLMAMWLVEAGILQFYDDGGAMLGTVNLWGKLAAARMAA